MRITLKNLSVDIPRDKFVVLTGLKRIGESLHWHFDTIYAEGQKIYGISVFLCQTVPWPEWRSQMWRA